MSQDFFPWTIYGLKQTRCTHRATRKRRIHQMIEGEAFPDGLFPHRRYNLYWLISEKGHTVRSFAVTTIKRLTFEAQ